MENFSNPKSSDAGYGKYVDNAFGPDQILPASSFKTSEPDGTTLIYRTESGYTAKQPCSVYSFFKRSVDKFGDVTALCIKRNGTWRKWTYTEYFEEAQIVAKALIKLGLERFHGVCIMGSNSPEWVISSFGTVFAGGFSAGIYQTNSPEACAILAENCQAQVVFVEDEVCLKKFLAVKHKLPDIKAFVQWSGKPNVEGVLSWLELLELGNSESDKGLRERLSLAAVNQCCVLIYTSGTTGPPKGVMLSQDHMTWTPFVYGNIFHPVEGTEVVVSYLPLSHLAAHMTDMYCSVYYGTTVYFAPPEALKGTLVQVLQEVRPTMFVGVPRVWEKIYEKMQETAAEAGFVKRTLGAWAKYHGANYNTALTEGRGLSSLDKVKFSIARMLLLKKVRQALGLDRTKAFASGSAPIAPEILEYYCSLDLPILEGYGLSESLSVCSFTQMEPHLYKIGSVGKVSPATEVKIINTGEQRKGEGEICIRGRNIFMGYLRMPDKTDEAIDEQGWLRTGDLGRLDHEGFLYITGRLKELVITAGGENIPPVLIEDAIKKELPCVSSAMLVGDKRKYLTILLTFKSEMNLDTGEPLPQLTPACCKWLREHGFKGSLVAEAVREVEQTPRGRLGRAIQQGIERYNDNRALSHAQRVQKWAFLPHDFSLPTEELNNTLKLKRTFVATKYSHIIDKMYEADDLKSKL